MSIILNGQNGETFPSWTTATRPASPSAGQTGFNTTSNALEYYNGSIWVSSGGQAVAAVQTSSFTAAAGNIYPVNTTSAAVTVTLPASPSVGNQITVLDYAGTAATNNITIAPNGNKIQGGTTSVIMALNRQSFNLVYVDSTQGWVSYADEVSGLPIPYTISYLVVAGGGGGGWAYSGGAGACGLLSGTAVLIPGSTYTVIAGAGGSGGVSGTFPTNGSNSSLSGNGISTVTAIGGGYGGQAGANGYSGGSGGGGGGYGSATGGSGTSGQGNAGGGFGSQSGGGGGGAGAVGASGSGSSGGNGGIGVQSSITGSAVYYAGGGGGGSTGVGGGNGGSGGGGSGSGSVTPGTAGTPNTGGGVGGGGTNAGQYGNGGAGGSGIVILSIPTSKYTSIYTGTLVTPPFTNGSNTILEFASSGTYTA